MNQELKELAAVPMRSESAMQMVDIVVLKWKCPDVESSCVDNIIRNTDWPFKLTLYDNRWNTPNTSRIWNKLIAESTCDYICVMDSDVFVPKYSPCWLTRMMLTFAYPNCKLVLPTTNRCFTAEQVADRAAPYGTILHTNAIWAGFCFLLRKSLLDDVGKFDEEFVGYGQDSEFAFRLARKGGAYIRKDVWVEHLHGASFKQAAKDGEHDVEADRAYARELYDIKTRNL